MVCKFCWTDKDAVKFSVTQYKNAFIRGEGVATCLECNDLTAKERKLLRKKRLGEERSEQVKPWRKLTLGQKREKLIESRTRHERMLGAALTEARIDYEIQVNVGCYFVDFQILPYRLAVEVDGSIHEKQKGYDKGRDKYMRGIGWEVLRFSNDSVEKSCAEVVAEIRRIKDLGNLKKKRKRASELPPAIKPNDMGFLGKIVVVNPSPGG